MKKGGAIGSAFLLSFRYQIVLSAAVRIPARRGSRSPFSRTRSMCEEAAHRFARAAHGQAVRPPASRRPPAAKSPCARDQKTRHLQILGIQEFTWKAEYNAAEFLLRLPLRLWGDQNAGKILELCRCDRLHLRDRAVGGDFNQSGTGCEDQIFIGVGNKRR